MSTLRAETPRNFKPACTVRVLEVRHPPECPMEQIEGTSSSISSLDLDRQVDKDRGSSSLGHPDNLRAVSDTNKALCVHQSVFPPPAKQFVPPTEQEVAGDQLKPGRERIGYVKAVDNDSLFGR